MKRTGSRIVALPAVAALAIGLAACGASNETPSTTSTGSSAGASSGTSAAASLSGTLNGAGATSQQAAQQAWVAGFNTSNPQVTINYDAQGSGAGVSQFLSKAVSFAGSDVALTSDQQTQSQTSCASGGSGIDIPVYISPIALAYNLSGVSNLVLSPKTAASIFAGKITNWNDPAIAADNSGTTLPDLQITVVHRSDKSGTTNNFTDWLHKAAPAVWTNDAAETWPLSGGEAAQGTSGVIQSLQSAKGSIGYADASQATPAKLGLAQIKLDSGNVAPTSDAAAATLDASQTVTGRPTGDIVYDINRTPSSNSAYPVILVSYMVVCTHYSDANTAGLVKAYATYLTSSAGQQAAATTAGSAPISDTLRSTEMTSINMIAGG